MPTIEELLKATSPITGSVYNQPTAKIQPKKIGFQGPTRTSRENQPKKNSSTPSSFADDTYLKGAPKRENIARDMRRANPFTMPLDLLDAKDVTERIKAVKAGFREHRGYSPDPDTISRFVFSPIPTKDLPTIFKWQPKALAYNIEPSKEEVETPNYAIWSSHTTSTFYENIEKLKDGRSLRDAILGFPKTDAVARAGKFMTDADYRASIWSDKSARDATDAVASLALLFKKLNVSPQVVNIIPDNVIISLMDKVPLVARKILTRSAAANMTEWYQFTGALPSDEWVKATTAELKKQGLSDAEIKKKLVTAPYDPKFIREEDLLDIGTFSSGAAVVGGLGRKGAKGLSKHPSVAKAVKEVKAVIKEYAPLIEDEGMRRYGFVTQLINDPKIPATVKAQIDDVYKIRNTAEAMEKAANFVTDNYDTALKIAENQDDEVAVFLGNEIIKRSRDAGDWDKVVSLTKRMKVVGLEAGRTGQAFSAYGRETPEGVLRYAQSEIEAFNNMGGNKYRSQKVNKVAKEIKEAVESGTAKTARGGKKKVESADKLASRVISHLGTRTVKVAPDKLMVDELFKIAKDSLPEKAKKPGAAALDKAREMFAKFDEGQQTYEKAKRIVLEKFKDNDQVLEAIESYEKSKALPPVHGSTVKKAIADELKAKEVALKDIVAKSLSKQTAAVDEIVKDMVSQGFSDEAAKGFARVLSEELSGQVATKKAQVVGSMLKTRDPRAQQTILEKVKKLSNLGVLDEDDYLDLARTKLKLVNMTQADAKKISGMSQRLQDMPESFNKELARLDLIGALGDMRPLSTGEKFNEAVGLMRALMASFDLSAYRQASALIAKNPLLTLRATPKMFTAAFNDMAYKKIQYAIKMSPNFELGQKAGLSITDMHSLTNREEAFRSVLAERIPLVGRGVKASNRAYVALLNTMRQGKFDQMVAQANHVGILEDSPETIAQLARFVNAATGRGSIKQLEQATQLLSTTLFSPRLMMSRLNLLNPAFYVNKNIDPFVRKEALKSMLAFGAAAASIFEMAKLGGAEVGYNPLSADFGKIKVGDTRYDLLGGFGQYIILGARLATGKMISSTTGKEAVLGEGYKAATRLDIIQRFLESKESPLMSFITTAAKGSDFTGEEFKMTDEIAERFIPMFAQDISDLLQEERGIGASVLMAAPGIFGAGVQTYGRSTSDIVQVKKQFMRERQENDPAERSLLLQRFKKSMESGDKRAAIKDLNEYKAQGGTQKAFIASIKRAHPLYGLKGQDMQDFIADLSPKEKRRLLDAIKKWDETYGQIEGVK